MLEVAEPSPELKHPISALGGFGVRAGELPRALSQALLDGRGDLAQLGSAKREPREALGSCFDTRGERGELARQIRLGGHAEVFGAIGVRL